MSNSSYNEWLIRHEEIIQEAMDLIKLCGLESVIVTDNGKPSFIRIFFGQKPIDFMVKEIRTKFARTVWLCKKEAFNPNDNYLIYAMREKSWLIVTGKEADREGEYRDSDLKEGVKFVVVSIDIFKPAKTFFKLIKKRFDEQLQKKITDYKTL